MREIKFRAWDEESKTMHIGMTLQQMKAVLVNGTIGEVGQMGAVFAFTFDDLVFMQYTGLRDVNGREIWEGDVVDISYGQLQDEEGNELPRTYARGVVAWNEHSTGWTLECKSPMSVNDKGTVMTSITHGVNGGRVVVGDVYRNPELV